MQDEDAANSSELPFPWGPAGSSSIAEGVALARPELFVPPPGGVGPVLGVFPLNDFKGKGRKAITIDKIHYR